MGPGFGALIGWDLRTHCAPAPPSCITPGFDPFRRLVFWARLRSVCSFVRSCRFFSRRRASGLRHARSKAVFSTYQHYYFNSGPLGHWASALALRSCCCPTAPSVHEHCPLRLCNAKVHRPPPRRAPPPPYPPPQPTNEPELAKTEVYVLAARVQNCSNITILNTLLGPGGQGGPSA